MWIVNSSENVYQVKHTDGIIVNLDPNGAIFVDDDPKGCALLLNGTLQAKWAQGTCIHCKSFDWVDDDVKPEDQVDNLMSMGPTKTLIICPDDKDKDEDEDEDEDKDENKN